MTTCARCGLPKFSWQNANAYPAPTCSADESLDDRHLVACRDRQIAAQAALLRSVTGKLEMLLTRLDDLSEPCSIRADLDALLEAIS